MKKDDSVSSAESRKKFTQPAAGPERVCAYEGVGDGKAHVVVVLDAAVPHGRGYLVVRKNCLIGFHVRLLLGSDKMPSVLVAPLHIMNI
jgi:hypothetical protein